MIADVAVYARHACISHARLIWLIKWIWKLWQNLSCWKWNAPGEDITWITHAKLAITNDISFLCMNLVARGQFTFSGNSGNFDWFLLCKSKSFYILCSVCCSRLRKIWCYAMKQQSCAAWPTMSKRIFASELQIQPDGLNRECRPDKVDPKVRNNWYTSKSKEDVHENHYGWYFNHKWLNLISSSYNADQKQTNKKVPL